MWSPLLKVLRQYFVGACLLVSADGALVIAKNALAQEESEEFSGDFSDPIDINLDRGGDGCAC